ncbi:hypothetical protein L596_004688 [Steinernema carpocapsae]|uniref:Cytochrome P450 n=1 Tax=Steinernema carpocapsae TaxID=34508 RepID=A0A4U8UWR2_STECR|nr:hypothetical protein L596_004688 [Steinernema carpocapsae]
MSLLFLCAIISAFGGYWLWLHLKQRKRLADFPSPRSWPIIGHAPIIKRDPEGFLDQVMGMGYLYPTKPRLILLWIGYMPSLMIFSPEYVEKIITCPYHLEKGQAYDLLQPWLGLSLLTSATERWRPRRKLLTPTFHYDILKDFLHVFNKQAKILVEQLFKSNFEVEIGKYVTLCALDIICETSMGRCVNAQLNESSDYVRAVYRINDIIQNRQKAPWLYNDLIFHAFGEGKEHDWALNVLKSFTKKVIEERQQELEQRNYTLSGRPPFLDLLLTMADKGQMSIDDVQSEVDTFMFEGHDTTATGLTWALHLLGSYPEVQEKVYAEVMDVIGDVEEITVEHLSQLKYLECCLKESLRLFPSVPIYVRRLGCDQEFEGILVPAGTQILINAYLVHRDPKHWDNPEEFCPERFQDGTKRHPYSFIPFSAGSRNCIGQRFALMEEKTVMAYYTKFPTPKLAQTR